MPKYASDQALLEAIVRSATDYAIITFDPDNKVMSWNPGAEVLLGWKANEIIGQSGATIFTPEDRERLAHEDELQQALAEGRAEDERWHIRKDGSRFWGSGVMVPLKGEEARGFLKILRERTKERQAELALRQSERRFRTILEHIPQLVWRSRKRGDRTWGSLQWVTYTGLSEQDSLGHGWLEAIHPDDRDRTMEAWHEAEQTGRLYVEHRTRRAADGDYRWLQTRGALLKDEDGGAEEWFGTSTDVHDLRRALERQQVLTRELHHRTRNLLGVVNSIARQTVKRSQSLEDFGERFSDRIGALARVQALVARQDIREVGLHELIENEVLAHAHDADGRITINGPAVTLHERASETLALAVHELATNAVKYGALASAQGRLAVSWHIGKNVLALEWRESGFSIPNENIGRGYGRQLIEVALPLVLGADTRLEFRPDGLFCSIQLPDHEWRPNT